MTALADGKPFFDTNILVYAVAAEGAKADIARALLAQGGALSVQVLNEFVAVARHKLARPWPEIASALQAFRTLCPDPSPLTIATHEAALAIANRYGFQIYDAMVLAAAAQAGCATLYSEDMQHGQVIDGLTIRNPFQPA